jgi:hypothetical protein
MKLIFETTTNQLIPQSGTPVSSILVQDGSGILLFATLGPGLRLNCAATCVVELIAQLPAPTSEKHKVTTATLPSFTLLRTPLPNELEVIRNGITLTEGEDYDVAGAIVTFKPAEQPRQGDLVRFRYR